MSPRMHIQDPDKASGSGATAATERRLQSNQLLQGGPRVVIEHGDASYQQPIDASNDGDLEPFDRLLEVVSQPFEERSKRADYRQPPRPH